MAQLPGYYISNVADIVLLPVIEAHEADLGEEIGAIQMETDGGKDYTYNQFTKEIRKLLFRVNSTAHLEEFRTMHDTVQGRHLAFYYRDSDGVTTYVKKQKDFLYRRMRGVDRFEITMELRQEPTDAEIDA